MSVILSQNEIFSLINRLQEEEKQIVFKSNEAKEYLTQEEQKILEILINKIETGRTRNTPEESKGVEIEFKHKG